MLDEPLSLSDSVLIPAGLLIGPALSDRKDEMVKATFTSLIAAALTVSTLMFPAAHASDVPATRAQAAPGWGFGKGISFGTNNFSGVVHDAAGTTYTCAADGGVYSLASTLVSKGSMKAPEQVSSLKVEGNVPSGSTAKKGTVTGKKELGQMAYIASLADKPSDLDAAATEAALARAAGVYPGSIWEAANAGKLKAKNADALKPAAKRSEELYNEAKKYAGPYTANLTLDLPEDSSTGSVRGSSLTSASGQTVPGSSFELAVAGPAQFSDGSQSATEKTSSSAQKVDIVLTGEGEVTATLKIEDVADSRPWISSGTSDKGRAQNLIVLGKKTTIEAAVTGQASSPKFAPEISTKVKDTTVAVGDPLVDVLSVSIAGGEWPYVKKTGEPISVKAKVDVYGPFAAPRAEVSDGAEFAHSLLGTYEVDVNGEGTYETDGSITAPAEGFYFFTARIDPKDQGELEQKIEAFESPFFEASETSVAQWRPTITSAASSADLDGGGVGIRDVITVSGMPEDHGKFAGVGDWEADHEVISHSLYFVPAQTEHVEGVTEGLEPIAMVETPAANGEYVIEAESFHIDPHLGAGTYQVVSRFAGDARVAELTTSDMEPSEQVVYTPEVTPTPEATPTPELTPTPEVTPTSEVTPKPEATPTHERQPLTSTKHPSVELDVTLPSPRPTERAELPNTGFDAKSLIPVALGLICVGSVAFLVVRRR